MQPPRTRSRRDVNTASRVHPIGTPATGSSSNTGPLAAASWLVARALVPSEPRWFVEVAFEVAAHDCESSSRFQLEIYAEEWGFHFHHAGKSSWIRVTDIPFVHGRDEHALLPDTPKLHDIGSFVRALETRFGVALSGCAPKVRTNIPGAEPAIVEWIRSLDETSAPNEAIPASPIE